MKVSFEVDGPDADKFRTATPEDRRQASRAVGYITEKLLEVKASDIGHNIILAKLVYRKAGIYIQGKPRIDCVLVVRPHEINNVSLLNMQVEAGDYYLNDYRSPSDIRQENYVRETIETVRRKLCDAYASVEVAAGAHRRELLTSTDN